MLRKAKASTAFGLLASSAERNVFRKSLLGWYAESGRDLPWRRTADPYAILVSEFMLQQTQVSTVIPYFERWLARFPDFEALAAAPESEVLHAWQGLGYYARARNLHRAARFVAAEHGGQLPGDAEAISRLPGVGRYTAGAVASFAFDRVVPAVDANIARVLARLANFREPIDAPAGAARIWEIAAELLPVTGGRLYTSALMELGALVCTPRQPRCLVCPVSKNCAAVEPQLLPVKKPRRKTVRLLENCGWMLKDGGLLLERQTGPRWKGLWKLPRLEEPPDSAPLLELEYPFTHHRVTLRVFMVSAAAKIGTAQEWFQLGDLEDVAMAAPHRRALRTLAQTQCRVEFAPLEKEATREVQLPARTGTE